MSLSQRLDLNGPFAACFADFALVFEFAIDHQVQRAAQRIVECEDVAFLYIEQGTGGDRGSLEARLNLELRKADVAEHARLLLLGGFGLANAPLLIELLT